MERQPEPLHQKQHKQQDDQHGPHKAQLLTDHGEDEVVVALGQPELFFNAVAKAEAGHAAGTDGVQALQGLVRHLGEVLRPAVEAALQVRDGINVLQQCLQQKNAGSRPRPGDDAAVSAQQQDGAHDGRSQHDAGHVGLQHQQRQHQQQGQQRNDELPHQALVEPDAGRHPAVGAGVQLFQPGGLGGQMGREQDHLKLGDLRYLHRKAAERDPAAAAVERRAEQHQHQQYQTEQIPRPDQLAQKTVVDIGKQGHGHNAKPQTEHLAADKVQAVAKAEVACGVAGTEQHHQPEDHDDAQRRHPVDEERWPGAGVAL